MRSKKQHLTNKKNTENIIQPTNQQRQQSYHVLVGHGVPPDNIVVLSADDAASSPFNPRPGTLINSPDGSDVRAGVPIDYRGSEQVTADIFLSVLLGDAEGARRLAPNGTGRVLQSTASDRVFVFYSDHGAPGLLVRLRFFFFFFFFRFFLCPKKEEEEANR